MSIVNMMRKGTLAVRIRMRLRFEDTQEWRGPVVLEKSEGGG